MIEQDLISAAKRGLVMNIKRDGYVSPVCLFKWPNGHVEIVGHPRFLGSREEVSMQKQAWEYFVVSRIEDGVREIAMGCECWMASGYPDEDPELLTVPVRDRTDKYEALVIFWEDASGESRIFQSRVFRRKKKIKVGEWSEIPDVKRLSGRFVNLFKKAGPGRDKLMN